MNKGIIGGALIGLGYFLNNRKIMNGESFSADEGDFMAEVARRDSRKTSVLKNPNVLNHPQGLVARDMQRFSDASEEEREKAGYGGRYSYSPSAGRGGYGEQSIVTGQYGDNPAFVRTLVDLPQAVTQSYITEKKQELYDNMVMNTPEFRKIESDLISFNKKDRNDENKHWRGEGSGLNPTSSGRKDNRLKPYEIYESMVAPYITIKISKSKADKFFKGMFKEGGVIAHHYGVGEDAIEQFRKYNLDYEGAPSNVTDDEVSALMFEEMWNGGYVAIKRVPEDIFTVSFSPNFPDRDITNPYWLDNMTKLAIDHSKNDSSFTSSEPLLSLLNIMTGAYLQGDFITENPHILTVQRPTGRRQGMRYHDVDPDTLKRQYRQWRQKDAIKPMLTMTLDFTKVKPIIERNVADIEEYMEETSTAGQTSYEDLEKKAFASIKRMLPKVAASVAEQILSTSTTIEWSEEEVEDSYYGKRMVKTGEFYDTATMQPTSKVNVSFIPTFSQLGGRSYDNKDEEWRLSVLSSWTTEDMQQWYENWFDQRNVISSPVVYQFNPSMLDLGRLLRDLEHEYNANGLQYEDGRNMGHIGSYQEILQGLKNMRKDDATRPIEVLRYMARTPKLGKDRIYQALIKAGIAPTNSDSVRHTKASLSDCLVMCTLGGSIFYPNENRGRAVDGTIKSNDQAQGQLIAASKHMASQARSNLLSLASTMENMPDRMDARKLVMDMSKTVELLNLHNQGVLSEADMV